MKLTPDQIQQLYTFTRQHYVEHYDLQTELVDHLANDIEHMWESNPKLSFEDAKNKAFKKFGVFGFMEAIENKQKAMNKNYRKHLWVEIKIWFEWPQLAYSLLVFLVLFLTLTSNYARILSISIFIMILIWSSFKTYTLKKTFKQRQNQFGKKWMLEELIFKQAGGTLLIVLTQIYHFFIYDELFPTNLAIVLGISFLFTALILVSYISLVLLPHKAETLLQEQYPEYSLS